MISLSIPKVLFIKGVFKKDCTTDDFLEKKVIDTINNAACVGDVINSVVTEVSEFSYNANPTNKVSYKKLPSIFESIEQWPKKTNLLCWHCSLSFDTIPIFIPKVIEPVISKTKKNQYSIGVSGVFCSFGDAMEFIKNSNWTLMDKIESVNKLKHLYKIFYNIPLKDIVSYPSVFDMIQYGGDIEINKYREIVNNFKTFEEYKMNEMVEM
jgi:hypothetical protein